MFDYRREDYDVLCAQLVTCLLENQTSPARRLHAAGSIKHVTSLGVRQGDRQVLLLSDQSSTWLLDRMNLHASHAGLEGARRVPTDRP